MAGLHRRHRGGVPQVCGKIRRRQHNSAKASFLQFLGSIGAVPSEVGLRRRRGRNQPMGVRPARTDERGGTGRRGHRDGVGVLRSAAYDHDATYLLPGADRSYEHHGVANAGMGEAPSTGVVPNDSRRFASGGGLVDDCQADKGHHVPWLAYDL